MLTIEQRHYVAFSVCSAVIVVALLFRHPSIVGVAYSIASCGLVWLAVSHVVCNDERIPDHITLSGMLVGQLMCGMWPEIMGVKRHALGSLYSLGSMALTYGAMVALNWLWVHKHGREGMGMGVVKALTALSAFVGVKGVFLSVMIASVSGCIEGVFLKYRHAERPIHMAPHLCLGGVVWMLWGSVLWARLFPGL